MTADDLRPFLTADPFEPFTISMAGGWSHDIVRPEDMSFTPHGSAEARYADGRRAILSLDHVVSITFADVPVVR